MSPASTTLRVIAGLADEVRSDLDPVGLGVQGAELCHGMRRWADALTDDPQLALGDVWCAADALCQVRDGDDPARRGRRACWASLAVALAPLVRAYPADRTAARLKMSEIMESVACGDALLLLETHELSRCYLTCPEEPSWICDRRIGHGGRHESPDGGDWYDDGDIIERSSPEVQP